jgi:BAI1-associated protein 3
LNHSSHFRPITDNANDEILVVEVWDFDPAETVREKIGKISEVKGAKGLRKLFKDVIVTASSGKHDNELIGRACIPLNTIPASGRATWFSLEKKLKTALQGVIKIRLSFSSEKNRQVAAQEHRHLLKMLLLYELETSKVVPYWWAGKFSNEAETILTQHSAQSGLPALDLSFVRWSVYSDVHASHPLSFSLFEQILDKLMRPVQSEESEKSEEIKLFWEATIKFLPTCFSMVRKIRKLENTDKNGVKTLNDVLNIISKVSSLQPPEAVDLFPAHSYKWLRRTDLDAGYSLHDALNDAVHSGATTWFQRVTKEIQNPDESNDNEKELQYMVRVIQMVRSDLQKAIEYYDKSFKK